MRTLVRSFPALVGILGTAVLLADVNDKKDKRFTAELYFQWEEASDPQISPDGSRIVYVRRWPDTMTDRRFSNIWAVNFNGSDNRALTTGEYSDSSPRWAPDGKRLAFISTLTWSRAWMKSSRRAISTRIICSSRAEAEAAS